MFDGVTDSTSPNHIDVGEGSKFIVIDLGGPAMVDGLNVWRYYNDVRQYHDVVYQLSTTSDFSADVTTVFNNDANNSTQQGAGSDPEYREGPSGKPVYFPPVRARYLRLWSSGNTLNNDNHYTEVEVYGLRNLAFGKPVSQSGDAGYDNGSSLATDGNMRNAAWDIGPKATGHYRQVDIGGPWNIDSLRVWHELSDSRRIRYKDVVFRISTTADFSSDVTTVFNNDLDNSLGLGAGTDGEYDETESGKIVHFPTTRARYIRLHTYGNIYDDQNRLLEVMVGQRAPQDLSEPPVAMAGALVTLVDTAGNVGPVDAGVRCGGRHVELRGDQPNQWQRQPDWCRGDLYAEHRLLRFGQFHLHGDGRGQRPRHRHGQRDRAPGADVPGRVGDHAGEHSADLRFVVAGVRPGRRHADVDGRRRNQWRGRVAVRDRRQRHLHAGYRFRRHRPFHLHGDR